MRVNVLGVGIDAITKESVLVKFKELSQGSPCYICKVNAEFLVNAKRNDSFRNILNHSAINTADGTGVLWAGKLLSLKVTKIWGLKQIQIIWQAFYSLLSILFYPRFINTVLPERVGGADLMWDMLEVSASQEKKIFLLGGENGVAEKVREKTKKKISGIKIVGTFEGASDDAGLIDMINASEAEVLFVAFGSPKQEFWIYDNLSRLDTVKVAIGEGGSFDFLAGEIKRAPKLMQKVGMEWLWRLIRQPRRIGRIYKAVPVFIYEVVKWKLAETSK